MIKRWCAAVLFFLSPAYLLAQSTSVPAPHPAAIVGGQLISEDELNSKVLPQMRQLQNQEYQVKNDALNALIDQKLLEQEAAKRAIPVGELLRQEVDEKTPAVTDAEVQAFYEAQKARINQPLDAVKDQLQQMLLQSRAQQVRQGFLSSLRDQANVSIFLPAPRIDVAVDPNRIRGNPNAAVTIVEFSDFQCPYCQRSYPTVQSLLAKYSDEIKFSYRDFPLRSLHPQAELAAVAGRCAGEQGKFWQFHDELFGKPNLLTEEELAKHAATIGLDSEQFQSCLGSGRFDASIEKDMQDGMDAGVTGTPAFFINGILLSGALPASTFEKAIDSELAAQRKTAAPAP
jgi:protein-disulfide isomerase